MQRVLSSRQIEAFYHDEFVEDQVGDFLDLIGRRDGVVVDIGGGCGFFAHRVMTSNGQRVRVLDLDRESVSSCRAKNVEAYEADALAPPIHGDEAVAAFNLILHHLVAPTEKLTRELQVRALSVWRRHVSCVFVNEYIYESFVPGVSGSLIYLVTKSRMLSAAARAVARIVPAFRANTFGVGVRFRSRKEWIRLFSRAGYDVVSSSVGEPEHVSPPLRLLLIKTIRRDSFHLEPRVEAPAG